MRKYYVSLKTYVAAFSSLAFGFFSVISCLIIWGIFYHIFGKDLSFYSALLLSVLSCILAVGLNFTLLYFGMKFLIRPIKRIKDTIDAVANGDFSARAERKVHKNLSDYVYMHELDEVIVNLNKMAQHLELNQNLQKEFISNVSHEIKTPIFSIAGLSELMLENPAQNAHYSALINKEANRLNRLCDDLLKLARLDNSSIVKLDEVVQVDEQLRSSVILLTQKYPNREFVLNLNKANTLSNAPLLAQIWQNLIENAIKYSPDNKPIEISCKVEKSEIEVVIKDHGIGIEAKKIDKIFDRFYQCEESHSELGSGLGLSIVAKISQLLSVKIDVKSKQNFGTQFILKIPKKTHSGHKS
ncbi:MULTISPECIES: HAMP domain-containing sensor histidine kinase [unclassified Campylobacter]|uniref:HAMP domain-containing sensor histidine kinase n=1 Tax=unclassified Campylobacter TaxID=2593542 RepID=UPI003D333115